MSYSVCLALSIEVTNRMQHIIAENESNLAEVQRVFYRNRKLLVDAVGIIFKMRS